MSFKDSVLNLWNRRRQNGADGGVEANMLNGGHTGYHPAVAARQQQAQEKRSEPQQPMATPNPQQPVYDPNFYQNTGFQQNYQNGGVYQGTSWQTGYQPVGQGYMPYAPQPGYNPNAAPRPETTWQPAVEIPDWQSQLQQPMNSSTPTRGFAQGQQTGFAQQQQPTGFAQQQQPAQQPYTEGNVTYAFGQQFRGQDGVAYNHVERLAQPLSVATCFRLIEFMRNGESIIVNLELVPDESERDRCLDMLCGAAFTMQCSFTRVASRCIYLIAPRTVQVLPYESIRQLSEQDADARWPRENAGGVRTDVRWGSRNRQGGFGEYDDRRFGSAR